MRKIYVVGGSNGYANWMEGEIVSTMQEADLVVFTGGEDVNPALYDKRAHPATYFNRRRDSEEIVAFDDARSLNKKIVGVCRGAQLLCALAGGILVQNQTHPWVHSMAISEDDNIQVKV